MKITLSLFAFAISVTSLGQSVPRDSVVDCVIHWRLGEKKTYSIIHEKTNADRSGNRTPFRFLYEAHISVIDSSSQSFTVKWEFGLPEAFKTMHPHLSDSLPVFNGMPMIFKISNNGAFVTLVNWEQVKETYIRQMEMSLPRNPDSVALASIKAAEQMFNSKEAVESSLIKEIQLFHTLYGYQFTTRETSAETQLPNPFGGEGFPAHQTYQITNYDKRKDIYTIVTKLKIDKGNLNKIIDPLLKKMNIQDDGSIEEARNQLKSYNMEDYTEYHFTKSTGWISRLFYARTVSTAITNQSESFTIELK